MQIPLVILSSVDDNTPFNHKHCNMVICGTVNDNLVLEFIKVMAGKNRFENNSYMKHRRRLISKIFLAIILMPLIAVSQKPVSTPKVLMVVSSYGKDGGKTRPGFEFDEFTQAYLVFTSNGLLVDVASPKGGNAEPDEYNKKKPYNKTILANTAVMDLLKRTKPTAAINGAAYNAVVNSIISNPSFTTTRSSFAPSSL